MKKELIAFILGLGSFLVMMFIGETFGLVAAFASLAVYFFLCQFLLSRGHADAIRTDWRIMLALGAMTIATVLIMAMVETRQTVLAQAPGFLLAWCGGTLAGALVASLAARRATPRG